MIDIPSAASERDGDALEGILAAQAHTGGPTYSDFLRLDELLALQPGFDGNSDSLLFFVTHQTKELWMRVMEVEAVKARDRLFAGDIHEALQAIARLRSIQQVMIESWNALSTLTPMDYLSFRDQLGTSSGFQSPGYRKLEFVLGQKDPRHLAPHVGTGHHEELRAVLDAPSLYDAALHHLARIGIDIPADRLDRDWAQPYVSSPGVLDAWRTVYTGHHRYAQAYRLGETLVDVEYDFQMWRFKHYKTVERIIGSKPGTGGSSGVGYLKLAMDRYFYPELWAVRSEL